MRRKSILLVILSLVIFLGGCGTENVGSIFQPHETEKSNTVYIASERVSSLNPIVSFDEQTFHISKLIYSSLFDFDENLIPVPDLVSAYEYQDNGKTLSITLKKNVLWHDGEKLSAEDVKFTIEAIKYLANYCETPYAEYVKNIRSVKLSQDDDLSLTITFGSDVSTGIENLTFPILPAHVNSGRNQNALLRTDKENFIPVGTGMYEVSEYHNREKLVLVSNEAFYGTKAENTLVFEILPNVKEGLNMMEIGSISYAFLKDYDRDTFITDKQIDVHSFNSNETEVVGFNTYSVFTSNKNVRQAIAYLIDNAYLLDKVYYNNGSYTDTILYPGYYGAIETGDNYEFNPEEASKLLKRAGLEDRDNDGKLESVFNEEIWLRIIVDKDDPFKCKTAEFIKKSLEEHGIVAVLEKVDALTFKYRIENYDYELFVGTCKVNERHDLRSVLHSFYNNPAGYSDTEMNKLIESFLSSVNSQDKLVYVNKIEEKLKEDLPYYPLVNKTYGIMYNSEFEGEISPTFNDVYNASSKWYLNIETKKI